MSASFECPHCGASVREGAKVCRTCGSDADTGWQSAEELDYAAVDIPDGWGPDDGGPAARRGPPRWVAFTALVVALAMLAWVLRLFG